MIKKANVCDVVDFLNNTVNDGVSLEEFTESGIYRVMIGCRGFIEEIVKVENFKIKTTEELIKELSKGFKMDDYFKEFVYSGTVTEDNIEYYYEVIGEEESFNYFNVVV